MGHLDEAFARLAAYALRGRIRGDQLRVFRLQVLKLLHQLVELAVADLRIIYNVVEVFVVPDPITEGFDFLFEVFAGRNHRPDYIRGQQKGADERQPPESSEAIKPDHPVSAPEPRPSTTPQTPSG